MRRLPATALVTVLAVASCVGNIGDGPGGEQGIEQQLIPTSGLRRMTASEFYNTVQDLLQDNELPVFELLPADARTPFDNDYKEQVTSQSLIDAADYLAQRAAERLLAEPERRDAVVGCIPESAGDEACMRSFVKRFGRRALRRDLNDTEIDHYVNGKDGKSGALFDAAEVDDFYVGVETVIWSLMQDPEFLYRVEVGAPVDGQPEIFRLSDFEMASRLSYFIWGSMPDDALLDEASAGRLRTADQRAAAATRLLDDARARKRVARFHALWLGYEQLPHGGELGASLRLETAALMERVIFTENRPWTELFTMDETFVTPFLAEHYEMDVPEAGLGAWVPYAGSGRAGLLSHGSFLSIGAKFNDTSPVQRGLVVRERLFCQDIGDPPPNVVTDDPIVAENAICKPDRLAAHTEGGCANCHNQIDPIGYGLERYDQFGRYRTYEPDNPDTPEDESQCLIDGQGEFEFGSFSGPGELGALAVGGDVLAKCLAKQTYRFVSGRSELDATDRRVVRIIQESIGDKDFTFADLVRTVVTHDSFAYRTQE